MTTASIVTDASDQRRPDIPMSSAENWRRGHLRLRKRSCHPFVRAITTTKAEVDRETLSNSGGGTPQG
ncbi:hypothetical protein BV25DRAFT_1828194, partial [Artomyces pyxidatus]